MKRRIYILLFVLIAVLCTSFFTACGEECSEGLNFVLMEDGTYGVRCGKITSNEIVIPAKRFGIPVTKLLDEFFIESSAKLELNESYIGKVTVKIPEGITEIGDSTFYSAGVDCTVILPASVKHIGKEAFASSGVDVIIPSDSRLETIGEKAFYKGEIKEFVAPDSLRSIEKNAFDGCKKLTKVDLSRATQLKKITENCFSNSGVTEITLNEEIESIEPFAFYGSELDSISLPRGLKTIGSSSFGYCQRLKSVDIPMDGALETIADYAFECCVSLKSFRFPQNLTNLESYAFYKCNTLVEMYVPVSSKILYKVNSAYLGVSGYGILEVHTDMEAKSIIRRTDDGFAYIKRHGICILLGYYGVETEITLPDTLEGDKYTVAPYAFYCSNVTKVTVSNGVTGIGDFAFSASHLEWINIPDSVARIGKSAFYMMHRNELWEIVFEGENEWSVDGKTVSSKDASVYIKRKYVEFEWRRH